MNFFRKVFSISIPVLLATSTSFAQLQVQSRVPLTPLAPLAPAVMAQSLFTTQVPDILDQTVGSNFELGMRFTAATNGSITAIRFYKSPSETNEHVGNIFSAGGELLTSVTFTNETASGWQQQELPTPLPILSNTQYTVSVNTSGAYYAVTPSGLSSQIVNGDLSSVVGDNGVSGPVGSYPVFANQDANYFRDIVFTADSGPVDLIPPVLSAGSPAGVLPAGTTAVSLALTSDEKASCRYATIPGLDYNSMSDVFVVSGDLNHSTPITGLANGDVRSYFVKCSDLFGNVNVLDYVISFSIAQATATPHTLFTTQIPKSLNVTDGVEYELGTRFKVQVAGKITGIRYFKSARERGSHIGKIYNAGGTLLAKGQFAKPADTATGWQVLMLPTPLNIQPNTEYIVSVTTGNKFYVSTTRGLANSVSNGFITSIVGRNGVYGPIGKLPKRSWKDSNYFRDVIFVPAN